MGQLDAKKPASARQLRMFEKALLNDIGALEQMLEQDMFESGVSRIGAEQELFLIDRAYRPCPKSIEILAEIENEHFTTELASFNLEFNLDPLSFRGKCLSTLEKELRAHVTIASRAAHKHDAAVILTGILPTIRKSDLTLDNMTPKPRYFALNEAMNRLRGKHYDLFLRGIDELYIKHDSVMLESCNTSFQVHFQVSPKDFVRYYNIAQAVAAPVLAAAANSPFLFGRRLWNETRIAVFQQSTDTRSAPRHIRNIVPRVTFGRDWLKESILEIYKEDIARFRVLFTSEIDEDPFEKLKNGEAPLLKALQLHNGTIYRWTRPCYGVTEGKAHLRIENRLFPSGPTVVDEIANAAFWLGLINGIAANVKDIREVLDFDEVRGNFYAAARRGLRAQFSWMKQKTVPAQKLIRKQLLPLAHEGLKAAGVDRSDIDKYLGIIKERVSKGRTGSQWILASYLQLKKGDSVDKCLHTITKTIHDRQMEGKPIHEWPLAKCPHKSDVAAHYKRVLQFMTTDLFTVNKEDTIDLVISVMNWRRIRHIPVEDNQNRLVGLVNYRSLIRVIESKNKGKDPGLSPVSTIMQKNVPTVAPDTTTLEAIALMREKGATCLPVVLEDRLVGIITEHDFMNLTAQFLEASAPPPKSSQKE